jgi:Tectonin domain
MLGSMLEKIANAGMTAKFPITPFIKQLHRLKRISGLAFAVLTALCTAFPALAELSAPTAGARVGGIGPVPAPIKLVQLGGANSDELPASLEGEWLSKETQEVILIGKGGAWFHRAHGRGRVRPADDAADIKVYYDGGTRCSYRVNLQETGKVLILSSADTMQDPDFCPSGEFTRVSASQADTKKPPAQKQTSETASSAFDAATSAARQAWYDSVINAAPSKGGCFVSSFPNTALQEVPCGTAPDVPHMPRLGTSGVGNTVDYTAQVSGLIKTASGTFSDISGVISEASPVGGNLPYVLDAYTLQVNSNTFASGACGSASVPANCLGWQQFVFSNSLRQAYMQYWLLNYQGDAVTCPAGWIAKVKPHCFKNSVAVSVPAQSITELRNLSLRGDTSAGGNDRLVMRVQGGVHLVNASDSVLGLAGGWNTAEFNVFGDCCFAQAVFSAGSKMTVHTTVDDGTANAPSCFNTSFTGETNSMDLTGACTASGHAIEFTQSSPPRPDVGLIYVSTGASCDKDTCLGWRLLDNNNSSVRITGAGGITYQLHGDGQIFKYLGQDCVGDACVGWQMLDTNPATIQIAAGTSREVVRDELYQLHNSGQMFRYTGTPCNGNVCTGWQMLDSNPNTLTIAAGQAALYQLHKTGRIFKYTGTPCANGWCPGWQMLDNNPATVMISAGGNNLYQLHDSGKIFHYKGAPCNGDTCWGWEMLDNNPQTVMIAADAGRLWQLHTDGTIYGYTGVACNGNSCTGWTMFDKNPATIQIATSGQLFQLHNTGKIYRSTGVPCNGNSCTGWEMLDNNPATGRISAFQGQNGGFFQMHSPRTAPKRERTCHECR